MTNSDKYYLKWDGYRSDYNAIDKGILFFCNNILKKHSELQRKLYHIKKLINLFPTVSCIWVSWGKFTIGFKKSKGASQPFMKLPFHLTIYVPFLFVLTSFFPIFISLLENSFSNVFPPYNIYIHFFHPFPPFLTSSILYLFVISLYTILLQLSQTFCGVCKPSTPHTDSLPLTQTLQNFSSPF